MAELLVDLLMEFSEFHRETNGNQQVHSMYTGNCRLPHSLMCVSMAVGGTGEYPLMWGQCANEVKPKGRYQTCNLLIKGQRS